MRSPHSVPFHMSAHGRCFASPETCLHILKYSHNKEIELRIPPSDDNPRGDRSWDVQGPEYSHQAIMLWHDNLSLLKTIPDVEAVHVQRFLLCRIVDAKFCFSGKSLLVRRFIYQIRLPRCQSFHWYYDQKEED
jgi:hypothetical protein